MCHIAGYTLGRRMATGEKASQACALDCYSDSRCLLLRPPLHPHPPFRHTGARPAESMVQTPHHRLHAGLYPDGISRRHRAIPIGQRHGERPLTTHYSPLTSIVCVGISLITIGMLFGALWAKEAWGHYWSWDPKETWAAITWFAYLVYVHYRQIPTHKPKLALWVLLISFVLLQMCWWGIKYLPAAQGSSVHVYSMAS